MGGHHRGNIYIRKQNVAGLPFSGPTAGYRERRQTAAHADTVNVISCHSFALKLLSLSFSVLFLILILVSNSHANEIEMLCLINEERVNAGVHPLKYNNKLAESAEAHSVDMARRDYFGHRCPDGDGPGDRAGSAGYVWSKLGETIMAGSMDITTVVQSLMNSPGHRAVLLSPDFCDVGIGLGTNHNSRFQAYWTQVLGRRSGLDRCNPAEQADNVCRGVSSVDSSSGGGCFIASTNRQNQLLTEDDILPVGSVYGVFQNR